MARKIALFAAGVLVGVGLWGGIVSASSDIKSPQTLHFIDKTVKTDNVDVAPKGPSQGDESVSHDILRQNGKQVGTVGIVSTVTEVKGPQSAEVVFTAVAKLPAGQLSLAGKAVFVPRAQTFNFSVTGGTGNYRNARGYGVVKNITQTKSSVTIYLIP